MSQGLDTHLNKAFVKHMRCPSSPGRMIGMGRPSHKPWPPHPAHPHPSIAKAPSPRAASRQSPHTKKDKGKVGDIPPATPKPPPTTHTTSHANLHAISNRG
eukprot:scaffold25049_cov79-Isochrysis_galbana.AAC.2